MIITDRSVNDSLKRFIRVKRTIHSLIGYCNLNRLKTRMCITTSLMHYMHYNTWVMLIWTIICTKFVCTWRIKSKGGVLFYLFFSSVFPCFVSLCNLCLPISAIRLCTLHSVFTVCQDLTGCQKFYYFYIPRLLVNIMPVYPLMILFFLVFACIFCVFFVLGLYVRCPLNLNSADIYSTMGCSVVSCSASQLQPQKEVWRINSQRVTLTFSGQPWKVGHG